jgi:hypothetical protein
MSYLSVSIPTSSSHAAKLPNYLSKSAFYDRLIYFRCGSEAFITIKITDKNRDALGLNVLIFLPETGKEWKLKKYTVRRFISYIHFVTFLG